MVQRQKVDVTVLDKNCIHKENDLFAEINGVIHFNGYADNNKNLKFVAKQNALEREGLKVFNIDYNILHSISKEKLFRNRVIMVLELFQEFQRLHY